VDVEVIAVSGVGEASEEACEEDEIVVTVFLFGLEWVDIGVDVDVEEEVLASMLSTFLLLLSGGGGPEISTSSDDDPLIENSDSGYI
jgi:hypothetical protein